MCELGIVMDNLKPSLGVKSLEQNNQAMLAGYIRTIKDLKAQNLEEVSHLTKALKERNAEVRRLKQESNNFKTHINHHTEDFKRYRAILSELKELAIDGALSVDVVHGPELQSLAKERDKALFLYKQELQKSEKFEVRCQAMSAQIIERQKKIYRLESLFMESDKECQYLQALLQVPEANEDLHKQSKLDVKQLMAKVVAVFQDLPGHVPGWLKTWSKRLACSFFANGYQIEHESGLLG